MFELLEKLWDSYPVASIAALVALDAVLLVYVVKNLKKLSGTKTGPNQQRQLLGSIKACKIEAEKALLIQSYNTQFAASDIKNLSARKAKKRLQAIRNLSLLGELHLYEIKKMIDDKDDGVALRAFRIITQQSDITNLSLLQKTMARAAKHKNLFASCILWIAKSSNHQVLIDLVKGDLPPWVAIVCMKALHKAQAGDLLPMLLNAQEHSSPEISKAANDLLNSNPSFQKFAS